MCFKRKCLVIIPALIFFLAICFHNSFAAWWQMGSLPVPEQTSEVKQEKRMLNGAEMIFYYYESQLDADNIRAFYYGKLTADGWKEKNLMQNMGQVPALEEMRAKISKALENNIMFDKDSESIMINFVPQGYNQGGKTNYTLIKGRFEAKEGAASQEAVSFPALVAKPKKNIAPVYPQAVLSTLSEQNNSYKAGYLTKGGLDAVSSFYKSNMAGFGWSLASETAPKNIEVANPSLESDCPTCPKINSSAAGANNFQAKLASLGFSNEKGDNCTVVLSSVSPTESGPVTNQGVTSITVIYDESKK